MIQEAITTAGQVVHNHWAGGISGVAITHFCHIVGPWLKANGGIPGAWASYIWPSKPVCANNAPTPISKDVPATETINPIIK